jgi:hypothetical protein
MEGVSRFPASAVRVALARDRYIRDEIRLVDDNVAGYEWLVASHRGIFAVSRHSSKTVIHGWFFGICRDGDAIIAFEGCNVREPQPMGRIIRLNLSGGRLTSPRILAKGLHNNCHQIRIIDGLLCLLDTAGQAIVRFDRDGSFIDVKRPFPPAPPNSQAGDYLHINSIAKVGDQIAIMLHNGKAKPEKQSEIAWLGSDWEVQRRQSLPGHSCHDIVEDETGRLWHSASMSGEVIASDGTRLKISDELMTRGIAITADAFVVGMSTFGPRHVRHALKGAVVILDRDFTSRTEIDLPGGPTDIIPLEGG